MQIGRIKRACMWTGGLRGGGGCVGALKEDWMECRGETGQGYWKRTSQKERADGRSSEAAM